MLTIRPKYSRHRVQINWTVFLGMVLEPEQITLLREALRVKAPVHFYGTGLGKGVIAKALRNAGFQATEPADLGTNIDACSVPNQNGTVCFCFKKESGKSKVIPGLHEAMLKEREAIMDWVDSTTTLNDG